MGGHLFGREVELAVLGRLEHEERPHHGLCIGLLELRVRQDSPGHVAQVDLGLQRLEDVQVRFDLMVYPHRHRSGPLRAEPMGRKGGGGRGKERETGKGEGEEGGGKRSGVRGRERGEGEGEGRREGGGGGGEGEGEV